MVDILLAWADSRDWAAALNSVVPGRKRAAAEKPATAASEPDIAADEPAKANSQPSSGAGAAGRVQEKADADPIEARLEHPAEHDNGSVADGRKPEAESEGREDLTPPQASVKAAGDANAASHIPADAQQNGDEDSHDAKRQKVES